MCRRRAMNSLQSPPSNCRRPDLQFGVFGNVLEVAIGTQQRKAVANTQMSNQRINGPSLHSRPPAVISQGSGFDVVVSVRSQERYC